MTRTIENQEDYNEKILEVAILVQDSIDNYAEVGGAQDWGLDEYIDEIVDEQLTEKYLRVNDIQDYTNSGLGLDEGMIPIGSVVEVFQAGHGAVSADVEKLISAEYIERAESGRLPNWRR
jgi:hypothetical protein|tara:strand:- start:109 stop:468 length:360 start_codon:yes stop_codon:yes gene_type:complete